MGTKIDANVLVRSELPFFLVARIETIGRIAVAYELVYNTYELQNYVVTDLLFSPAQQNDPTGESLLL